MHFDVCVLWISRLLYERSIQSSFYIILLNIICRELSSNRAPAEIKFFNSLNFYYVLIDFQVYTKFYIFKGVPVEIGDPLGHFRCHFWTQWGRKPLYTVKLHLYTPPNIHPFWARGKIFFRSPLLAIFHNRSNKGLFD